MSDSKPRRSDARRNREKILDIAEQVFAEEGLDIPMADVARRVGAGVGTLYRHFPTKQALFSAILTDRMEALVATGRDLTGSDDSGRAFYEFFDHVIDQSLANAALYTALSEASGVGLDAASSLGAALIEVEGELLRRAQRAGAVRDDIDPAISSRSSADA